MALSITGYVLGPVRVGSSNSPFTATPDAYAAAPFPSVENDPRAEYLVQVLDEGAGTGPGGHATLADASFGWTKNEGAVQSGLQVPFQRFDYDGQDQRFRTLPGAPRELLGALSATANATRLRVTPPQLANLGAFPIRVAVGATGSGTTFPVALVTTFGSPAAGTVQLQEATGDLHWNAGDLAAFEGQAVHFQRQAFYALRESNGSLGALGQVILLSPLPTTGQRPAIKIGSRRYLTAVERATEGLFSMNPTAGTVEWALTTGRLKFSAGDLATFAGQPVVYEGVFLGTFQVPRQTLGLAQGTPAGILTIDGPEGSDLYFRIPNVAQFPTTRFVDTFTSGVAGQVEVRRSDGAVQLSAIDRAQHSGQTLQAVAPDVPVDRGVVLRLFRSIVNRDAESGDVKDVTATYAQAGAVLASPIIGQPFVSLPALPLQDQAALVSVTQGTGSFLGVLNDLGVPTPPAGKGYLVDFDTRQLTYAERKNLEVLEAPLRDFGAIQLPNFPVFSGALVVELEEIPGGNDYQVLTEGQDFTIDLGSGVVAYTRTQGASIVEGTASLAGSTLTVAEDLVTAGVLAADRLLVAEGPSKGLYAIQSVPTPSTATVSPAFPVADTSAPYQVLRGREVLLDRFFRDIPPVDPGTRVERLAKLGGVSNTPRLTINAALATSSRFRFGKTTFSNVTSSVVSFTAPALLPQGTVEVDEAGDLNFSQVDVNAGGDVYWSRSLTLGTDYSIQPELGFIEFASRLLEKEEVQLRYTVFDDEGAEATVEERGAFLVSKEVTQAHPAPTTILTFNPDGREVASSPAPAAFRGGRPQSSEQVQFDVSASSLTFQPDAQVTDALPHGPVVGPEETVYVDYYVHEAMGGESNLTVSQRPMATVQVVIMTEDDDGNPVTSFAIKGDRRGDFPANSLLRVANSEVYLLAAPTFNGTLTTVQLSQAPPQVFRNDLTNPILGVTSGATRRVAVGFLPAYFTTETRPFDTLARGSRVLTIQDDVSRVYVAGTVLCLTDGLTFQEYVLVEGARYEAAINRTLVTLSTGVLRQHTSSALQRSVRPILNSPTGTTSTGNAPLLTLPYTVYRQVEGQVGQLLTQSLDYTLDESGAFAFTDALGLDEEIGIFYTGSVIIDAGRRTRASWTFTLVPTIVNGLLNQVLTLDYSTYIPDTFFHRIETMTNYRGEIVDQFASDARANSPSQGPILQNSGGQGLVKKGAAGLFFNERDLDNQDLVARPTLKYYNDLIASLEDWLQSWDGRAVGDHDGPFLFDGLIDNPTRTSFAAATNQIDDRIKIRSRTRQAFEAATYSRFYPTQRSKYGEADDPTGLETGDAIVDLQESSLKQVSKVKNRFPWASVTVEAPANTATFTVDHAEGDAFLSRPGLNAAASMKVAIFARDGTAIVPDASPATVASTTPTSVTLAAPVPAVVPQGATIRMATTDDTFRKSYILGLDVGVDLDNGFLTHIESSDLPDPPFSSNSNPPAGTVVDALCQVIATNTAPERFPALDGGTTDDDGDRRFPILGFSPHAELARLNREIELLNTTTGTLRDATTSSFVGSGTLISSTVLDNGVAWSSPAPKVGDLVRLRTSSQGTTYFHRINAVGATTVTVEPAFSASSGSVDFETSRGVAVVGGAPRTGALTTTTTLTDAGGNFISNGVQLGHTVVATTGTFAGQRRQIVSVDSATQLTTEAFTATGAITYQVVDSLATFGGAGSLQAAWEANVTEELRALEGLDFVDLSTVYVQEASTQTLTVASVAMGEFDALLLFHMLDNDGSGALTLNSATFNGQPLTLQQSASGSNAALFVYYATGLAGVTGSIAFTATDTSVSQKLYALKLSSIKTITSGMASSTTSPATLSASGALTSREAGDLVITFAGSRNTTNGLFPVEDHNTLIPFFNSSGIGAILRATRASLADQLVSSSVRVVGTSATSRLATVVVSKDVAADALPGRRLSEKAALEAFFSTAVPDRGLGGLIGTITTGTIILGNFTNVAAGDVVFIRHGPNAGVYTVASATDTSATVVETFPSPPQASVTFRAGELGLPAIDSLQMVFAILQGVEAAIAQTGVLSLQQHCPILCYRNGTPAGDLPGTPDSAFTSVGGVLTLEGARARPISSLATRAAFITARAVGGDAATVDGLLAEERLYDGRYAWIDGRINLETGILPKRKRAVQARQKALERVLINLTKLLTVG